MVDYKHTQKNRGHSKGPQFSAETEREIGNIWQAGNRISNGYGFWGSTELYQNKNPKMMVAAWVNALKAKGYDIEDIILYGDWTDGRHIADEIQPNTTYQEFYKIVSKSARHVEEVREGNSGYYKDYKTLNALYVANDNRERTKQLLQMMDKMMEKIHGKTS